MRNALWIWISLCLLAGSAQAQNVGFPLYTSSRHGSAALTLSILDYSVGTCNSSNAGCSTGTWNAPVSWALPPSTAFSNGKTLIVTDTAGVVTNTNSITLTPGSGDTINTTTSTTMATAGGRLTCILDTVAKNWACTGSIPNGLSGQLLIGQDISDPANWVTPSGDWTISPFGVTLNAKVNSVAYPASPSTSTVPVVTSSNQITYEAVPNGALANSSMTIAGHSVSLGGTQAIASTDLSNGAQVPLLNATPNTWTGTNTWQGSLAVPIRVVTASGAVTVSFSTDYMIVMKKGTPAATTINYTCPGAGAVFVVKDGLGDDATHNITLAPGSGTVDGASSVAMLGSTAATPPYQSMAVTCDASGNSWTN